MTILASDLLTHRGIYFGDYTGQQSSHVKSQSASSVFTRNVAGSSHHYIQIGLCSD